MARHHKKSRKTRRRRSMRGGYLSWNPLNWLKPAPTSPVGVAAAQASDGLTKTTQAAAPLVPSPQQQAAALGTSPGSAGILGSTASLPAAAAAAGGRRRRRTRKHRRRH
jgi:hypothetical protein